MTFNFLDRKYDIVIVGMVVLIVIMFVIMAIEHYNGSRDSESFQRLGIRDRQTIHQQIDNLTKRVEQLEATNFKVR